MGSQSSSTSLPSQVTGADSRTSLPIVTEKSKLVNEKPGAVCETVTEKPEEQNEKVHASKSSTEHGNTFLRLPKDIRNIIYSYAFAVKGAYENGVWRGVICLADEPGYPPKLCDIAFMHSGYQYNEDYLTERFATDDSKFFKLFIFQKGEAWCIEINRLKYVCKQLHRETRGITLKINAGKKLIFHGTRTYDSSGMSDSISHDSGRISGMANFVQFYSKCSPEQQKHIRNVDIIELPLDDEQPRTIHDYGRANDDRTRVEQNMVFKLWRAFKPRPLSYDDIEKRSFRRRCAELTGRGHADSKRLYQLCQSSPSLCVVVRYNEWQDSVDREYIKRMCSYHMALRKKEGCITMNNQEKEIVRDLVLRNGGAATSPSLDNLRMSSSVNFALAGTHPKWYFLVDLTIRLAPVVVDRRIKEIETLFGDGV